MAASTALETVADYVTDARVLLQDAIAPYRYDDSSLLTALNVTLLEARRLRADLFMRHHGNVQSFSVIDDSEVEMEQQFRLAILHGLVAHALSRDQEDIQDARSTMFLTVFNVMLVGGASPGLARPPGP